MSDPIAEELAALADRVAHGGPAVVESPYRIAPESTPDPAAPIRRDHRRLALLADHVADEAVDLPDAVVSRVFAAEEEASLQLGRLDPAWEKAQDRAEEAWREMLEDGRDARDDRTDWAWPA